MDPEVNSVAISIRTANNTKMNSNKNNNNGLFATFIGSFFLPIFILLLVYNPKISIDFFNVSTSGEILGRNLSFCGMLTAMIEFMAGLAVIYKHNAYDGTKPTTYELKMQTLVPHYKFASVMSTMQYVFTSCLFTLIVLLQIDLKKFDAESGGKWKMMATLCVSWLVAFVCSIRCNKSLIEETYKRRFIVILQTCTSLLLLAILAST